MRRSDLGRQLCSGVVRCGPERHPLPEPRTCAPSRVVLDEVSLLPAGVWHWPWTEGAEKVGIGPSFAPSCRLNFLQLPKGLTLGLAASNLTFSVRVKNA